MVKFLSEDNVFLKKNEIKAPKREQAIHYQINLDVTMQFVSTG
jgi:hypothetical protein